MGYVLREQTLAFRLAGHNLTRRLPGASLLDAAAACGIQETPTGSAGLAFAAVPRGRPRRIWMMRCVPGGRS